MIHVIVIMAYVFLVGFVGSAYLIASAVLALAWERGMRVPPLFRR